MCEDKALLCDAYSYYYEAGINTGFFAGDGKGLFPSSHAWGVGENR